MRQRWRLPLRRIFSDWYLKEGAWVVAPLAIWIAAFLLFSAVTMVVRGRVMAPREIGREMGLGWALSFVAVVVWLVGWAVWLTMHGAD